MMRIGFGATVLARCLAAGGVDGIGSYTRELLKQFVATETMDVLPISFGYPLPPIQDIDYKAVQCPPFAPSAIISAVSGLPFLGKGDVGNKIDLLHATDHLIPNFGKVPVVATLMDAIPLSHPEWASAKFRSAKNAIWRRSVRFASHVITISEHSKQEIQTHFAVPAEKITVIPLGVDERWFRPITTEARSETLQRYGFPNKFFLSLGTLQPRKNIARIIEAYLSLPEGIKNAVPLVIVGRAGWQCDEIVDALESKAYGASVIWLKHLPDDELLAVMKSATALVFPSLYEGFGLPVLEAFAAGTPVITSNITSLPEVAGDAALLVNPFDTASIAQAMLQLLEQPELANMLREKGRIRALGHSWNHTASMTLDVYRQILDCA